MAKKESTFDYVVRQLPWIPDREPDYKGTAKPGPNGTTKIEITKTK